MDGLEHFVSVQLVKNKQKQVNIKTRMELLLFLPLLSSSITWIEYNYFLDSHGRNRGDATTHVIAYTLRCTNRIDNSQFFCMKFVTPYKVSSKYLYYSDIYIHIYIYILE